jgi:hypothetical protein
MSVTEFRHPCNALPRTAFPEQLINTTRAQFSDETVLDTGESIPRTDRLQRMISNCPLTKQGPGSIHVLNHRSQYEGIPMNKSLVAHNFR